MLTRAKVRIVRYAPNLQDATRIAAAGFCQPESAELELDVHQHLDGGDLVYSVIDGERIVGFTIFNVWDEVLYLSGVILDPSFQGRGVVRQTVERARKDAPRVTILALRTQSSLMWAAGRSICWPYSWSPGSRDSDLPLERAGAMVASKLECQFPVTEACYNGPLYGTKPVHRNAKLQLWWDALCNFERGDAVICVGRF